jgi:hypothetical protein
MFRLFNQARRICRVGLRSINKIQPEKIFFSVCDNMKAVPVIAGFGMRRQFSSVTQSPLAPAFSIGSKRAIQISNAREIKSPPRIGSLI